MRIYAKLHRDIVKCCIKSHRATKSIKSPAYKNIRKYDIADKINFLTYILRCLRKRRFRVARDDSGYRSIKPSPMQLTTMAE